MLHLFCVLSFAKCAIMLPKFRSFGMLQINERPLHASLTVGPFSRFHNYNEFANSPGSAHARPATEPLGQVAQSTAWLGLGCVKAHEVPPG